MLENNFFSFLGRRTGFQGLSAAVRAWASGVAGAPKVASAPRGPMPFRPCGQASSIPAAGVVEEKRGSCFFGNQVPLKKAGGTSNTFTISSNVPFHKGIRPSNSYKFRCMDSLYHHSTITIPLVPAPVAVLLFAFPEPPLPYPVPATPG